MDNISNEILSLVGGKKRTKKPKIFDSDDEEEGEVDIGETSYSTTVDGHSLPGVQNNTQESSEPSSDQYDEDLMGDEEDRRFLSSLTEVEREAVLFERSEARRLKQERLDLKRRLEQREGKAKKTRSSLPPKKPEKTRSKRTTEHYRSDYMEEESEREEEEESYEDESAYEDEGPVSPAKLKQQLAKQPSLFTSEITFEQATQLTLTRDHVEKLLERIFFEDAVSDAFVRVCSGIRKENGKPLYRFAQIHSVVDYNKEYQFNTTTTDRAFNLIFGKSKKIFRIDVVSNSPPTLEEFQRWKDEMHNCSLTLPSQHQIQLKIDQIRNFDNQATTDIEINALIEQKRKLKKGIRNFTAEKLDLLRQRDVAIEDKNQAEITRLDDLISQLDIESTNQKSSLTTKPTAGQRKQPTFTSFSFPSKKALSSESKPVDTLDPFARRRCNPTIIHLDTFTTGNQTEQDGSDGLLSGNSSVVSSKETDISTNLSSLQFPTKSIDYHALHLFHIPGIEKNSIGIDESSFETYLLSLPKNIINPTQNSLPAFSNYNSKFNYW